MQLCGTMCAYRGTMFAAVCAAACSYLERAQPARKPLGAGGGDKASKEAAMGAFVHIARHVCVHREVHMCVPPPPLVQAKVNDQKLMESTPSVAWTRVLLMHRYLRGTRVDRPQGV